jgi:hypothetical protein
MPTLIYCERQLQTEDLTVMMRVTVTVIAALASHDGHSQQEQEQHVKKMKRPLLVTVPP